MSTSHSQEQLGFTLVELIVTIVVAGLFITVISQMNGFVVGMATTAHRTEMASNLAYNNMRIYANDKPPLWFDCHGDDATDVATALKPFNDGAKHPDAAGTPLINTTSSTSIYDLPAPVIQKVTAVAPYGCGNTITGMPIRIVSTVTYGNPAKKVVHATYIGY